MMIGSKKSIADKVVHQIEPIRILFGTLFFASIGLMILPTFLITEGFLLIVLTLGTIFFKILLTTMVLYFVFKQDLKGAVIVGTGLGQISEFTFVLASKAKQAQILSRDSYFLLIGVTTMSMVLSPLLWKIVKYITRDYVAVGEDDLPEFGDAEKLDF
jgi:Kef-type K+ transport system membrane component KefB